MLKQDKIRLHAWFYNIVTGAIEEYDFGTKKFIPIGTSPQAKTEEVLSDGDTVSEILKAS